MTTLQVLCRYGDDPSVGNFWVTMDELANALSALQATVPDGPDDGPPTAYSTYKWRVEAIGGHHDNWTHAALYACDAIPVSGDTHKRVLDALAAMTQRAEAAEAKLAEMTLYAAYCGIEALNDYPCHVLDLDEWQATPHCPECGATELYEMPDEGKWWCTEQHEFITPARKEVQP